MCDLCSSWGYFIGNAMYVIQRIASCCALTAVVICLIVTMMVIGGLCVGLGYHYCIVQGKTHTLDLQDFKAMYDAQTRPSRRRSDDSLHGTDFRQNVSLPEKTITEPGLLDIEPTMTIPLNIGVDFQHLIARIRTLNKNITLDLLAAT